MSRLRATLGNDRLETRAPGYRLRLASGDADVLRFEELVRVGLGSADRAEVALCEFDEALRLWRGSPYAEFASDEFAAPEVARLVELRARAIEERSAALLELSRPEEVLGELEAEIAAEPFRERLRALLMLALARAGRPVESEVVSSDRLVDVLWGDEPPPSATHTLQALVSRLRATLGDERLETRAPGYRLRVASGERGRAALRGARPGRPGVG